MRLVLLAGVLLLAGCTADSPIEIHMQLSQGRIRLEPDSPGFMRVSILTYPPGISRQNPGLDFNDPAVVRTAIRTATDQRCAARSLQELGRVPERPGDRVFYRVEC